MHDKYINYRVLIVWIRCRFLDTETDGYNPQLYKLVVSLSQTLYLQCFSRLGYEMKTRSDHSREWCIFSSISYQKKIAPYNDHQIGTLS